MSLNGDILIKLIEEDSGVTGNNKWWRSEDHSSLVINYEKGIFFYNAKGVVGDALVYLTKMRGMPFNDAKDYLKQFDYEGTHVYTIKAKKEDIVVYPKLVDVFYELGINNRDYFYHRTLTDSTIDRFQLGWYNGYNMIPIFNDGVFRNFQMRRDIPEKKMKKYYSGIGPLLFNPDILKLTDTVFYVEGPVDAMAMIQNGLPAISSDSGGAFLEEWLIKFNRQKKIILLFDNDSAGEYEAKRIAKILGTARCRLYTFSDFDEQGYDPVDFFRDGHTREELLEIVDKNSKDIY
jgi:DNA primase